MSNTDLLSALKKQVGKPGWVRAKDYYMSYLREEIKSRGLDTSTISDNEI